MHTTYLCRVMTADAPLSVYPWAVALKRPVKNKKTRFF